MGHLIDSRGIRRTLPMAVVLTALTAILIPLSANFVYSLVVVTAFTVSYTMIFIALYSRMSDVIREEKVAMTGVIATFKDLGYTIGPLLAGFLIGSVGMATTLYAVGAAFIVLLPVSLLLHD